MQIGIDTLVLGLWRHDSYVNHIQSKYIILKLKRPFLMTWYSNFRSMILLKNWWSTDMKKNDKIFVLWWSSFLVYVKVEFLKEIMQPRLLAASNNVLIKLNSFLFVWNNPDLLVLQISTLSNRWIGQQATNGKKKKIWNKRKKFILDRFKTMCYLSVEQFPGNSDLNGENLISWKDR